MTLDKELDLGPYGGQPEFGVGSLQLSDGTSITRQQLTNLITTGSPTKTALYGTSGPDVFDSRGYATYEQGNGGADTFIYNEGYGQLEIYEDAGAFNASPATLQLGTGISANNLIVNADGSGDLILTDGVTGDRVRLDQELDLGLYGNQPEFGVGEVQLSDGTTLSRQQLINLLTTGSSANTALFGTSGPDLFDSRGFATYEQETRATIPSFMIQVTVNFKSMRTQARSMPVRPRCNWERALPPPT